MMVKYLVALMMVLSSSSLASVGTIVETSGNPGQIIRGNENIPGSAASAINSMDTIVTGAGTARIRFVDDTRVNITEQSRLVIDEYVFDPRQGDNSRLAMRVGLGTVRYASGQIARINQQRVDIRTPSATIAVRGTDFFMTVDETGQSFVILVPSCDGMGNCRVGQIDVVSPGGSVTLSQAFTATAVANPALPPTPPVVVSVTERMINNTLIIAPPAEIRNALRSQGRSRDTTTIDGESTTQGQGQQGSTQDDGDHGNMRQAQQSYSRIRVVDETPTITATRTTVGEGVAWVRFGGSSSGSVSITHGGDQASTQVGSGASNTIVIRQGR